VLSTAGDFPLELTGVNPGLGEMWGKEFGVTEVNTLERALFLGALANRRRPGPADMFQLDGGMLRLS
jgi:hypothetical protein